MEHWAGRSLLGAALTAALVLGACAPSRPAATAQPPASASAPNAGAAPSGPPTKYEDLAIYRGVDREALLLAGAQQEGTLTWYTSLAGAGPKMLADAFQQRYGIAVEIYRADNSSIIKRFTEEQRARRHVADVIETTGSAVQEFLQAKQIIPYYSPHASAYPAHALKDAGGGLVHGIVDRESYQVFTYSTRVFAKEQAPREFRDLARPEFRGKIVMAGSSTGVNQVGNWLLNVGEDFARQMEQQQLQIQNVSGAAVLGLVVSGEFAASPTTFREHHLELRQKDPNPPVEFVPLEPVVTNSGTLVLPVGAPHPYAAILFADWLVAPDGGQAVFQQAGRGSAAKDPGFKRWYPEEIPLERYETMYQEWEQRLHRMGSLR